MGEAIQNPCEPELFELRTRVHICTSGPLQPRVGGSILQIGI
jgi:hypothetical protein